MASSLSLPSSSTKKLKQSYLNETASSDSETDYSGSSEEISVTFASVILPMRQKIKFTREQTFYPKGFVCLYFRPDYLRPLFQSVSFYARRLCFLPCLLLPLAGSFPVLYRMLKTFASNKH